MKMTGHYPAPRTIERLIDASSLLINKAMDSDDLAVRHNSFIDYVLALVFCATGHRPVIDPIHSQKLFDLERGWILINDKVVHEERAWRISALPPIACEQLQHYLEYLPRLAAWLDCSTQTYPARDQVQGLLNGKESIPFFFYLDTDKKEIIQSITPGQMRDRWLRYWKLPLNFLRHVAASELAISSGQPRLTQIQLGHSAGTDHAFGVAATESVTQVMSEVRDHAENFMQTLGWKALRSPVRMPKNHKLSVPASLPAPQKLFGSDMRKLRRKKNHVDNSATVRAAIKEITVQDQPLLRLEQLEKIQAEVIASAPSTQRNACLRLLYRFISRLQGGKALLKELAQHRELELEPSPFIADSLAAYQKAEQLRRSFLDYLDVSYDSRTASLDSNRIAEIILSASLFGGLATPQLLQALPKALLNHTYQLNNQLFLDLPLSDKAQSPIFRWFPDQVSQLLIHGFHTYGAKSKAGLPKADRIQQQLGKLLRTLGTSSEQNVWQLLSAIAKSVNIMELPGHTCAILDGRIASVSVPLAQWVRVQSGKALETASQEQASQLIEPPFAKPINLAAGHTAKQVREFLRQLISILSTAADQQARGNSKRSTVQKKQLEKLLKHNFVENSSQWSQPTMLVIAWALHLCRHGTRAKKNLAFNTIKKYVPMVARALLLIVPEKSFLDLEGDEFESLYLEIIEAQAPNRKEDIAGRLYEFHHFLIQAYAIESPAWCEIFRASGNRTNTYFADANIVSESEYLAVLDAIVGCQQLSIRQRLQYQVMLILGYRFGLRFGEAFRLQYRDIQHFEDVMLITVRNNIYGDLKSSAAQRIVPLLETLRDQEQDALSQLIQSSATHWEANPHAALMTSDSNLKILSDKTKTAAHLNQALKEITGDSRMRYHHLRHSWATRFYALHYSADVPHPLASQSTCWQHWSEFIGLHQTRYPLSSLATALGHLDESTTLASYVHSSDASYSDRALPDGLKISHKATAYALYISHDAAKQKSSRSTLFKLSDVIPQPAISLQPRPTTFTPANLASENNSVTPKIVERILLRARQTGYSANEIAREFLVHVDLVMSVINCAARVEQESGFDFYMVEICYNDKLAIHPDRRKYILRNKQKQKSYKQQDENILRLLDDKHALIENLTDSDKQQLTDALRVWVKTLQGKYNFINDEYSVEALTFLFEKTFPEIDTSARPANTRKLPEKSTIRKEASYQVTRKLGGEITTQQMLDRLMFVLATYVEVLDSEE